MDAPRALPQRHNTLLTTDTPSHADLVALRRLGQTELNPRMLGSVPKTSSPTSEVSGVFDYAHLRAPLPKGIVSGIFKSSPDTYFFMRRSTDGFVSATGMFKATFPWATVKEEESERHYIKSMPTTSPEETAGNIWVAPEAALALAKEYQILPWIRALLDPQHIPMSKASSNAASPPRKIASPPKFFAGDDTDVPPASPPRSQRLRRSCTPTRSTTSNPLTSPRKRRNMTSRAPVPPVAASSPQAGEGHTLSVVDEEKTTATQINPSHDTKAGADSTVAHVTRVVANEAKVDVISLVTHTPSDEPKLKVHVDREQQVNDYGSGEVVHTTIDVEMPMSGEPPSVGEAARMIAEAREMVMVATASVNAPADDADAKAPLDLAGKSKRKAGEIATDDDEPSTSGDQTLGILEEHRAKKARMEQALKKDQMRKRAFLGISATLAVGAIIPIVMSVL